MKKIMLIEYVETGMIKTAFIDDVTNAIYTNGNISIKGRLIPNVRKIALCDVPHDYDYKAIHDIIDTMMEEFNYSYEYILKNDGLFLRINVYKDSHYAEYHTIPLDKSKLTIEHIRDISTYIKRFIR